MNVHGYGNHRTVESPRMNARGARRGEGGEDGEGGKAGDEGEDGEEGEEGEEVVGSELNVTDDDGTMVMLRWR